MRVYRMPRHPSEESITCVCVCACAQSFWSRLSGQYGNMFYWKEKGEAESIFNAVSAIDTCLREPPGRFKCSKVQGEFGKEPSGGVFSSFFGDGKTK